MEEEEKHELSRAASDSAQNIVWINLPRGKPPSLDSQSRQNLESSIQAKDLLFESDESLSAPKFGISTRQEPDQSHRSLYAKHGELETGDNGSREEEKFLAEDFLLENSMHFRQWSSTAATGETDADTKEQLKIANMRVAELEEQSLAL